MSTLPYFEILLCKCTTMTSLPCLFTVRVECTPSDMLVTLSFGQVQLYSKYP